MGRPSTFTAADIATIGELRANGVSWRAIGTRLGRSSRVCRRVWVETLRNPGGWARPRGSGQPRIRLSRTGKSLPLRAGDPAAAISLVQL